MGYCPRCGYSDNFRRAYCPSCLTPWTPSDSDMQMRPERALPSGAPPPPPDAAPAGARRDGSPGALRTIAAVLIIAGLVAAAWAVFFMPAAETYILLPREAEFEIEREFTVNAASGWISSMNLHAAVPKDSPGSGEDMAQDVISLEAAPTPDGGAPDTSTQTPEVMEWSRYGVDTVEKFKITYKIKTRTIVQEFADSEIGNTSSYGFDDITAFTGNEWQVRDSSGAWLDGDHDGLKDWRIHPTNPLIRDEARRIAGEGAGPLENARSIFDYIRQNFQYSQFREPTTPKMCTDTWADRQGDCDDQSILYISLCRSLGIPARLELGLLQNPKDGVWQGHGWAGIMLMVRGEGGYEPVWCAVDLVNGQFLVRDAYRFADWVDAGDGAALDDYYHYFRYAATGISANQDVIEESIKTISFNTDGELRLPAGNVIFAGPDPTTAFAAIDSAAPAARETNAARRAAEVPAKC